MFVELSTIEVFTDHQAQEGQSPRTCWVSNSSQAELLGFSGDDLEARPLRTDWNGGAR